MKYKFSVEHLYPDSKEGIFRFDIQAKGNETYEESWYLSRSDIEVLAAKLQIALGIDVKPNLDAKEPV